MAVRKARLLVACAALLALTIRPHPVRSAGGDPARLVFLLEYVGEDYANAVRNGAVIDAAEYGEVVRFTKEILRDYEAQRGADEIAGALRDLLGLLETRAPHDAVRDAALKLSPRMATALGTDDRPPALPNLAAGRRLWINDCAPCHGMTGDGNGPSAGGMEPPPTAFRGELLERLPPRRIYHAITFGIDGTAMPAFAAAYSERQRWDVAFFAMTLRVGFQPKRPAHAAGLTLQELAALSNAELRLRLRAVGSEASGEEVDWLRANFPLPAGGSVPFEGPAGTEPGVAAAVQLQDVFAGVAERILPRVVGVAGYAGERQQAPPDESTSGWSMDRDDLQRYPGFTPIRVGTGFVVDDDGYVLTRDHLVRDDRGETVAFADVEFQDQSHRAARVMAAEPTLDLALLHIAEMEGEIGEALEFADSNQVRLGQWLIALGDPPGPGMTLAVGLASAPAERQCYQSERSATRLQTSLVVPSDALGGPVTNVFGNVVGMTVHQPPPPGVAADDAGATHVLPINLVLNLYEALKLAQSKQSPWLGVSVLELSLLRQRQPEAASGTAMPDAGVYIDDVFAPSPASRADVRRGDFLLGIGGHPVLSVGDFQTWLYVLGIGAEVELELQRDGKRVRVRATVEARPPEATSS
jgi:S1-C subfamily serine protease